MNRVIYKNQDGSVGILVPAQSVLDIVGLKAIAEKDVPQDLPYWLVMDADIPSDRSERNQWVWDTTKTPDGFGGASSEFTDAQLLALYNGGVV